MRRRARTERQLSEATYVELVKSLFETLGPTIIMGTLFIVVAWLTMERRPDPVMAVLGVLGGIASLARVAILMRLRRWSRRVDLDEVRAWRVERLFGATYLTFAALLGLFGARAMQIEDAELKMVVAGLVVGYAAGVSAGLSLRPWIGIPAVLIAVVPVALSALTVIDHAHIVLAIVLLALMVGGIGSMLGRYRSGTEKIAMRQTLALLVRKDYLTGLANRLALTEAFVRAVEAHGSDGMAVHCLDLDKFKPVNDRLGHPAGDALLKQVADRLQGLCGPGDIAARMGGDEFVLVQTGIRHPDEPETMARRIVRELSRPYVLGQHGVVIGASVGYAVPAEDVRDLDGLIARADAAQCAIKRDGGGGAAPGYGEDVAGGVGDGAGAIPAGALYLQDVAIPRIARSG